MTNEQSIQQLRLARCCDFRLSQEAMAQKLGVSLRTYTRYESKGAPLRVMRHLEALIYPIQHAIPASQ
jgi:transcriptional regulator with XRE-family HTH domain